MGENFAARRENWRGLRPGVPPPLSVPAGEGSGARAEYLQREITRLLLKNEAIRFELAGIRKRVARVRQALSEASSEDMKIVVHADLLIILQDLCRFDAAGDSGIP